MEEKCENCGSAVIAGVVHHIFFNLITREVTAKLLFSLSFFFLVPSVY